MFIALQSSDMSGLGVERTYPYPQKRGKSE